MKRRHIAGSLLAALLAACSSTPLKTPTLSGQWMPESAELGGQAFPVSSFDGATLNLTADTYEFAGDKGTYVLLSQGVPGKMDIHGDEGPNAERQIQAIYALDGDQLVICYQLGTGERPSELKSPASSQVLLVRYKRMQ